jgi:beta-fructofuranosidase
MKSLTFPVLSGQKLEFWAKQKNEQNGNDDFVITAQDTIIYKIPNAPKVSTFFEHCHYLDQELTIIWNPKCIEFSLFYTYHPETVYQQGISIISCGDEQTKLLTGQQVRFEQANDKTRPQLHFSPYKAWLNDPNGLCKIDDYYHMFYQFHPNSVDWGPMHWGHAVSKDLFKWQHLPIFLQPQNNLELLGATGGAFSGNAFKDNNGDISFYYTERLPAYDLIEGYKEIQKRAVPDSKLLKPISIETVIEEGPEKISHDFRDPKVWYDTARKCYLMVLATAIEADPAVLLYRSDDGIKWQFASTLYQAPEHFKQNGARSIECPDFIKIDDIWVMIVGFVGYVHPKTGRHNLLFSMTGDFDGLEFTPFDDELQELDFGTDFYALQSFHDGERHLAFSWLFNWEFRKPLGSNYSGEMSLPRVLSVNNKRKLLMQPAPELEQFKQYQLLTTQLTELAEIGTSPIHLHYTGNLDNLVISITSDAGDIAQIKHSKTGIELQVPEKCDGMIYTSEPINLTDLTVVIDRGIIEVFANHGLVCGTKRSYKLNNLKSITDNQKSLNSEINFIAHALASGWNTNT